jgi:hypothetical protein
MSTSVFDQLSRRVASRFLSTVVVVDDQALLAISGSSESPRALKTPGRQGGGGNAGSVESAASTTDSAHRLDAKKLTDSFARIGVVCSVLRPEEQEMGTLEKALAPIFAGSDVVILDWVLHEYKQGEKTMEIIKEMLRSSGPDRGRARLIIVYTGENDLDQITASIRTGLKLPEQTDSDDPFTIERGAARICVYAKEQSRLPAAKRKRKIEVANLPEVVVEEFANMTRGLVSNVALLSLAALRANTYQLLKRFHRELDPPYVTHSTLLVPEEASDHLIPLIVSEIQAVLEDEKVSDLASIKRVVSWLNHQLDHGLAFTLPQHISEKEFRQGLAYLLQNGVGEKSLDVLFADYAKFSSGVLKNKKKAIEAVRDQLTGIMTLERDRERVKDHELAVLMSVRSRYASPAPHLTLGSIVLETRSSQRQYLLCVQPRCDSVRLNSERSFPFLPMKLVADDQKCDFIIEEKGKTTRLRLNDRPFEVRMISFKPASEKQVLARRVKSGRFFKASGTTSKYRWVADLKPEQAQRVANEYAYKLSRVGLTESEWLRKWMPGLKE